MWYWVNNIIVSVVLVCVMNMSLAGMIMSKPPGSDPSMQHIDPKLLVVLFDGFRWDYLDKVPTPNFDWIRDKGVKAKWIKDTYPTITIPNLYTMVTGLYGEAHGMISNAMYDPVWNQSFITRYQPKECNWFGGVPIWVTNQQQGDHHRTGIYFWPGSQCDDPIGGVHPTFYKRPYNPSTPFNERIDTVVNWFNEEDINLGLMYYSEPDHTGHIWGPDSPQIREKIKECDKDVGYLLDQLEKFDLLDKINVIVTSDHGMAEYTVNRTIYLDDYVSPNLYHTDDDHPFKNIWPHKGQKEIVYEKLKLIPHLNVFYKEEIPEKFHYKNNRRVAPIFIESDLGWQVVDNRNTTLRKGDHGWNNDFKDMHPFFLAMGPAFKEGLISEPFNNVDIYPLMCSILKLKPAPNNGSLENVKHLLEV